MKIKLLGIALFALLFIGSLHSFAQEVSDEISIHIERIKLAFAAGEISEEEAEKPRLMSFWEPSRMTTIKIGKGVEIVEKRMKTGLRMYLMMC